MAFQFSNVQRNMIDELFKNVPVTNIADGQLADIIKTKIEPLREKKPESYKIIIGMFFTDSYCNLSYRKKRLSLDEDEQKIWELINKFNTITDVIQAIDDGKISLKQIAEESFLFTLKGLYERYLCYESANMRYLLKFNPYALSEFLELARPCSLDEAIEKYQAVVDKFGMGEEDEEETEDDELDLEYEVATAGVVYDFKEKLLILAMTNREEFRKMMLEMIRDYYRVSKTYEYNQVPSLAEPDFKLFKLIETREIDEVIEEIKDSPELLTFVIDIYLDYKVNDCIFSEEDIDICYEENIPLEIQQKLEDDGQFSK